MPKTTISPSNHINFDHSGHWPSDVVIRGTDQDLTIEYLGNSISAVKISNKTIIMRLEFDNHILSDYVFHNADGTKLYHEVFKTLSDFPNITEGDALQFKLKYDTDISIISLDNQGKLTPKTISDLYSASLIAGIDILRMDSSPNSHLLGRWIANAIGNEMTAIVEHTEFYVSE